VGAVGPTKARLEAFSDGVIAIILTLMVLEIKRPHLSGDASADFHALRELLPHLVIYLLSFLITAIIWVNHHHMFHLVKSVDAKVLWYNLNLLFWMSLIPLPTGLLGEQPASPLVNAFYGAVLFMMSASYYFLRCTAQGRMYEAVSGAEKRVRNRKNLISAGLYLSSIPLAFVSVQVSWAIFLLVPAAYFIPERADVCLHPKH